MPLFSHGVITECHVPFSALATEQILTSTETSSSLQTRKESKRSLLNSVGFLTISLAHMEATVFYAFTLVINTFFVVSSCQDEGKTIV